MENIIVINKRLDKKLPTQFKSIIEKCSYSDPSEAVTRIKSGNYVLGVLLLSESSPERDEFLAKIANLASIIPFVIIGPTEQAVKFGDLVLEGNMAFLSEKATESFFRATCEESIRLFQEAQKLTNPTRTVEEEAA